MGKHVSNKKQFSKKKNRKGGKGTKRRKDQRGTAVSYITRTSARNRLQLTLRDFRRLCILKGIYPRDPKKKVKGKDKTYYYLKDIKYLAHDPLLKSLREYRTYKKRVRRFKGRAEHSRLETFAKTKPEFPLDHVIRDRYPTFRDALNDLDDALVMVNLFTNIPQNIKIKGNRVEKCVRLCREFEQYVILSRSLKKTFISIKGIYYQAEIQGQAITWLVPHHFPHFVPRDVDLNVMMTFLHVWETLVHFVNYKLFSTIGLHYPPHIDAYLLESGAGLDAMVLKPANEAAVEEVKPAAVKPEEQKAVNAKVAELDFSKLKEDKMEVDEEESDDDSDLNASGSASEGSDSEEEEDGEEEADDEDDEEVDSDSFEQEEEPFSPFQKLFAGCKFFFSRETPILSLEFVCKAFGGKVSWSGAFMPYPEDDEDITHQIVDRDTQQHLILSRDYVQPQWVYDCINAGILLPVEQYAPTAALPPHLSPFVNDEEEGYIPERRKEIAALIARAQGTEVPQEDQAKPEEEEEGSESDHEIEERYLKELEAERAGVTFSENAHKRKHQVEPVVEDSEDEEEKPEGEEGEDEDSGYESPTDDGLTAEQRMKSKLLSRKERHLFNQIRFSQKKKKQNLEHLSKKAKLAKEKTQKEKAQKKK